MDREAIGAPEVYGNDRVFAYVRLKGTADASQDAKVAALEAAGHPVVHFEIGDLYEIFGQFFTWEIATAVAGSVIGHQSLQPAGRGSRRRLRRAR